MKKSILFVFALCLICMAACQSDDIQFEKGNIPRDIAYKLVLKGIDHPLEDIDIWASKEKIKANTVVSSWGAPILSPGQESWLFFVDEVPDANWAHPCQYIFVDMDGNIYTYSAKTPPSGIARELVNMSEITSRWYSSQYGGTP